MASPESHHSEDQETQRERLLPGARHVLCVTVLAQLHIWHKSHTLPGSSICTVACLLVTHQAGKFYLHCCLFASHAPWQEVPSALLPVCSTVSSTYKNFSCSPSFCSSSFLFSFLVLSCTSIQVSSLKPSQVKVTESVRLEFCSAITLSHYERLYPTITHFTKPCSCPCHVSRTRPSHASCWK